METIVEATQELAALQHPQESGKAAAAEGTGGAEVEMPHPVGGSQPAAASMPEEAHTAATAEVGPSSETGPAARALPQPDNSATGPETAQRTSAVQPSAGISLSPPIVGSAALQTPATAAMLPLLVPGSSCSGQLTATGSGSFLRQRVHHTGGLAELLAKVGKPGSGSPGKAGTAVTPLPAGTQSRAAEHPRAHLQGQGAKPQAAAAPPAAPAPQVSSPWPILGAREPPESASSWQMSMNTDITHNNRRCFTAVRLAHCPRHSSALS